MVIKLLKHELKALFRVMLYLGIATLAITLVGRLLLLGDSEGFLGRTFSFLGVYLSLLIVFIGFLWSVRRFYSSLFTGEGYMTFSLPVTPVQIIWSKLLSALIMSLFGLVLCVINVSIVCTAVPREFMEQIFEMLREFFDFIGEYFASDPMVAVEFIIIFILAIPMNMLFFYSVISVGQLFTKGRKWITFAIGVAAIIVVLPLLSDYCLQPILDAASRVSIHLSDWIGIVLIAGTDVGCFFLIRFILSKHVNLIV